MIRFAVIGATAVAALFVAAPAVHAEEPLFRSRHAAPPAEWDGRDRPPALFMKVHRDVMAEARYLRDPPGENVWRATTNGDCKDLALEMRRRLELVGVPRGTMRVLVTWKPSYRQWHAALLVRTDGEAWVLDSLRSGPIRWDGKGVEFQVGPKGRRVVAINGSAVIPTPWRH